MDEFEMRIAGLFSQNIHCSQVMMLLANETRGVYNPELIRALGGLGGGMFCHKNCGTLTGGAAVLASYGALGEPGDEQVYDYHSAVKELVAWFEREFGSVECSELVSDNREEQLRVCPAYVAKTFARCLELLEEHGIDPSA